MKNVLNLFTCMIAVLFFNSCKHDNFKDFVGPQMCPTSNFIITEPFSLSSEQTKDTIDFNKTNGEVIKAAFNEEVVWTITITGKTSGANKVYTGRSMKVDTVWFGQSHDPTKFFQKNEEVSISLSISCLSTTYTKVVTIADEIGFINTGAHFMVSDFDGHGFVTNDLPTPPGAVTGGWGSYVGDPNVVTKLAIGSNVSSLAPPQGKNYLTIQGQAGVGSWYTADLETSLLKFPAYISSIQSPATDVYFNAFMSSGDNSTTLAQIIIGSGGLNYSKNVTIDWKGWKMVSIRLSDFKNPSGDPLTSVSTMKLISFGLNCATATNQATELDLDFIVLSVGGPFFQ